MAVGKRKLYFVFFALIFSIVVILASNNVFQDDPGYFIVPHGDHNHYVPHDYNRSMSVHEFPQRPPREGERITRDGRIVRDGEGGFQFYNRNANTSDTQESQAEEETDS